MAGFCKDEEYTWEIKGKTMNFKPFKKTAEKAHEILRELRDISPEENWNMTCLNKKGE